MSTPLAIPVVPATRDELYTAYGVVAVLLPTGPAAIEGFSNLVDDIMMAPHGHKALLEKRCIFLYSARQYTLDRVLDLGHDYFSPTQTRSGAANDPSHADSDNDTNTVDDDAYASTTSCASTDGSTDHVKLVWHGFLCISLRHKPAFLRAGWSVGYQPDLLQDDDAPEFAEAMRRRAPDVPICSEKRGKAAGLHRVQVTFNHIKSTATFGFRAEHKGRAVKCDSRSLTGLEICPLTEWKHCIEFGRLQYWFMYLQVSDGVARRMKHETEQHISRIPGSSAFMDSASATPTPWDKSVGNWTIKGVAGSGASSIMETAMHKTSGQLAVARSMLKNDPGLKRFLAEIEAERLATAALRDTRYGRCHIQRLVEYVDSLSTTHAFYTPLCRIDLARVLEQEEYSDQERQILFTQLIWAVQALHAVGWVHGDIKPQNICLQSRLPLRLVLIDTAGIQQPGRTGIPPTPGARGTIGYLAPEQESSCYSTPVDIWAVGCVGVELLLRQRHFALRHFSIRDRTTTTSCNVWRPLNTFEPTTAPCEDVVDRKIQAFHDWRKTLSLQNRTSKEKLLYQMLEVKQKRRITADAAAQHPFVLAQREAASEASQRAVAVGSKRQRDD